MTASQQNKFNSIRKANGLPSENDFPAPKKWSLVVHSITHTENKFYAYAFAIKKLADKTLLEIIVSWPERITPITDIFELDAGEIKCLKRLLSQTSYSPDGNNEVQLASGGSLMIQNGEGKLHFTWYHSGMISAKSIQLNLVRQKLLAAL